MLGHRDLDNTVGVLFGGRSSEHEISLRSAVFVLKQMPRNFRIVPIGLRRDGSCLSLEGTFSSEDFKDLEPADLAEFLAGRRMRTLPKANPVESLILPFRAETLSTLPEYQVRLLNLECGVFFPVLHGPNGEDGRLQGVFEMAEVAYVGCDIRASVIGIDKHLQKLIARQHGVPVAKYELIELEDWQANASRVIERVRNSIGFPCFVKPNSLGSAVGVNRAKDEGELSRYIHDALAFDDKALVEEPMTGTEVECAFLGTGVHPKITVAGEIAPKDFYSYEAKYQVADGADQFIPARLDAARMEELQGHAAKLARAFSLSGLSRLDFWNCQKTGRFVFNEVNTLPGLTSISMFPKLWEHEGVLGPQWISELIEAAKVRRTQMLQRQFGITAKS
ncbi:MAG: D-alanine--D-alanine ligase family protein [Silvanigrellaceae bacterium]